MENLVIWGVVLVGALGLAWDLWRDWRRHDPHFGTKVVCGHLEEASH